MCYFEKFFEFFEFYVLTDHGRSKGKRAESATRQLLQ